MEMHEIATVETQLEMACCFLCCSFSFSCILFSLEACQRNEVGISRVLFVHADFTIFTGEGGCMGQSWLRRAICTDLRSTRGSCLTGVPSTQAEQEKKSGGPVFRFSFHIFHIEFVSWHEVRSFVSASSAVRIFRDFSRPILIR